MTRATLAAIVAATMVAAPLAANYSSMTPAERAEFETMVRQAWEWRAVLDGKTVDRIVEAVRVDGDRWRVRVEIAAPKLDGGTRAIQRDVFVEIKASRPSPWPYFFGGTAAGAVVAGVLCAIFSK